MRGTQLRGEGARKGDRSREDKELLEFGDVIVTYQAFHLRENWGITMMTCIARG